MPPAAEHRGDARRAAYKPGAMYRCFDIMESVCAALLQRTALGARSAPPLAHGPA